MILVNIVFVIKVCYIGFFKLQIVYLAGVAREKGVPNASTSAYLFGLAHCFFQLHAV